MSQKKILFLVQHRLDRSPGQRFRFEQYVPYLEAHGFECHFSPLLPTPAHDQAFYGPGQYVAKAGILLNSWRTRLADWRRAHEFDAVVVYREAIYTGQTIFEKLIKQRGVKIALDFDDAIWLPAISANNRALAWLKNADKLKTLIALSDLVMVGNSYLADYARQFNPSVAIVPTTLNTDIFTPQPAPPKPPGIVEIGWTGSHSTVEHFEHGLPALRRMAQKYGDRLRFKLIGDARYQCPQLGLQGTAWRKETELADLATIDIGIMPLPDTPWARGKCGFKGLTYMALGLPAVMSPVGVNRDIVQDGHNGFLADSTEEWVEKLSALVESAALRRTLGQAGRQTVVERFSVASQQAHLLQLLRQLTQS